MNGPPEWVPGVARRRERGSALVVFISVLVIVLAIVGLALESALSARREESVALSRSWAREAAEIGASRAYAQLLTRFSTGSGFTTAIQTNGGYLWTQRQACGPGLTATWKARVQNNQDGGGTTDVDYTCVLYVTGRAPTPSEGDAVYNLVKTLRASGTTYPALFIGGTGATGNVTIGNALTDNVQITGKYGSLLAGGLLTVAAGSVSASGGVGYGTGYLPLPLTSVSPAPTKITNVPSTPTTTASDAWAAAKGGAGATYILTGAGTVTDANGTFLGASGWNGWVYALGIWTHATNVPFTPAPGTIYSPDSLVITGGPATAQVSFISNGSVSLTPLLGSLALTPLNGISIFADQDVLLTSTALASVTLGTAAAPGYVVAGEQVGLVGTGAGINVNGSIVAKDSAFASPIVLTNSVVGKVTVTQSSAPSLILGTPVLTTLAEYEALSQGSNVASPLLPTDASEGPLGVYR